MNKKISDERLGKAHNHTPTNSKLIIANINLVPLKPLQLPLLPIICTFMTSNQYHSDGISNLLSSGEEKAVRLMLTSIIESYRITRREQ